MLKTVEICDGCGKQDDTFISRKVHKPGSWDVSNGKNNDVHACSRECALKVDAAQIEREKGQMSHHV